MANHNRPATYKHGASKNPAYPEYVSWMGMRQRCTNPRNRKFPAYGGRGIRVCERWNDFTVFLADVGRRPSPIHTIDRIDVNGHYEPNNVRWADPVTQANNRRPKSSYQKRRRAPDGSLIPNSDMTNEAFVGFMDLLGMSQEATAEVLGVTRTAVRKYRQRTSIPQPVADKITAAACAACAV